MTKQDDFFQDMLAVARLREMSYEELLGATLRIASLLVSLMMRHSDLSEIREMSRRVQEEYGRAILYYTKLKFDDLPEDDLSRRGIVKSKTEEQCRYCDKKTYYFDDDFGAYFCSPRCQDTALLRYITERTG